MDEQFVVYRSPGVFERMLYASTQWLGLMVERLRVAKKERHRCADVLALTMRHSALGG